MNQEKVTSITSSAIAVIVVIGAIVLTALQLPIPDALWSGFGLVLGFFFGNQTGQAQARAR